MLILGQSIGFLVGLETVDRMGERLELLFDWGLLGGWAVTLELLRIVFAARRGRARMENSQLKERWGVGFSVVSFEYMDPALSAAGVHSWTCELRSFYFPKALSKILERQRHADMPPVRMRPGETRRACGDGDVVIYDKKCMFGLHPWFWQESLKPLEFPK